MKTYYTEQTAFFGLSKPTALLKEFGSPLYLYNEAILRDHCREMAGLISYPDFSPAYSIKANSNPELLRIIREEGFGAEAVSPGEIQLLLTAGFRPEEILFVANNVSVGDMEYALNKGVLISCDSISQLRQYGRLNPGGAAAVRFNPGIGAGHHEKVITGGGNTKFGVDTELIDEVKSVLKEHSLKLIGINQHIGSLFMSSEPYIAAVKTLLALAEQFEELEFIDMGGGFGIPYHKQDGQQRLNLRDTGRRLTGLIEEWTSAPNHKLKVKIEPGRYIVAECGILLGTVHAVKQNSGRTYIGTDIGFNVFTRPVLYDSYHDMELYKKDRIVKTEGVDKAEETGEAEETEEIKIIEETKKAEKATKTENAKKTAITENEEKTKDEEKAKKTNIVTVVGNICETGDILAKDRALPPIAEGDIIGIMDAGAYGYSMSSNYNCRLRPAEVLIGLDGSPRLIRRRETVEDLEYLYLRL